MAAAAGFVFAGSGRTLAAGVHIAGVDVGGMTPSEARGLLERRSAALHRVPVTFVAGARRWRVAPAQLGVEVDWVSAVDAARRQGEGFGPVRGLRRLQTRFFGADVAPPTQVFQPALSYQVGRFARALAQTPREPSIELRGLKPVVVGGRLGQRLDRAEAERTLVRALSAFSRAPVALPVEIQRPRVTAAELVPVARQVRIALSAPVRLRLGATRWRLPRWRIAQLLDLPRDGRRRLAIGGPEAAAYFERLSDRVGREPVSATFVRAGDAVSIVPGQPGVEVDVGRTSAALLAAARRRHARTAEVAVARVEPELTTAEAKGFGITTVLATYSTAYAGTTDRISNLRLAVELLDGALVAPGATFSFNDRVGERTEERGFRSAPVIIGGKYEEGVGGGVSQVATTLFNAAWESGLPIPERAQHALYIARYPDGRDATVNFPNLDLKFVNDTGRWLFVRASWDGGGIAVSIYGPDTGRRVVSEPGELREVGPVPVKLVRDRLLDAGARVVEEEGQPPRSIVVKRTVYGRDGEILRSETWRSYYRGEPKLVRVGTKPPPAEPGEKDEERAKKKQQQEDAAETVPTPDLPPR